MRTPGKKSSLALGAVAALASATAASIVSAWQRNSPRDFVTSFPWRTQLEPGAPRKVGVVFNPVKNRVQIATGALAHSAERAGWPRPLFYPTTVEDPGTGMARQALEDGCDLDVAAGGDGTVRAVASALEESDAVMGLVPLGTGNLLARNLEIPINDLHACVNSALFGTPRHIDTIETHAELVDGGERRISYLVMGGAGFDAQIMTDTREDLKSRWGWIAYVEAGLRNLVSVRHSVTIRMDDHPPVRRKTRSVLIANTGELQAGIRLAADCTVDDQRLEVILLTPRNLLGWAILVWQVMARRRMGLQVIEHLHGTRVEVDFMSHPQPMEVDGDPIGTVSRLRARVRPASLAVNIHPENQAPFRNLANLATLRADMQERAQSRLQRLGWGAPRPGSSRAE